MTKEEYISNLILVKEKNVDYISLQDCLGIIADTLIFLLNDRIVSEGMMDADSN